MKHIAKYRNYFIVAFVALTISACGGTTYIEHHDDHHYVETPSLYQFHVIDTYGTNTEFDAPIELALSPYVNSGHFEAYWDLASEGDYFTELRINDIPSTDGSRLITSDMCGPYYPCHDNQYQFCEYTADFDISCETPSGDFQREYVGDMIDDIPDDLYLIFQVCDSSFFYCEYETRRVSME